MFPLLFLMLAVPRTYSLYFLHSLPLFTSSKLNMNFNNTFSFLRFIFPFTNVSACVRDERDSFLCFLFVLPIFWLWAQFTSIIIIISVVISFFVSWHVLESQTNLYSTVHMFCSNVVWLHLKHIVCFCKNYRNILAFIPTLTFLFGWCYLCRRVHSKK